MAEENKSSLSGSRSYQELSEYWDTHSLAEHWEQSSAVEFEVRAGTHKRGPEPRDECQKATT
jgi:hypothetical protein